MDELKDAKNEMHLMRLFVGLTQKQMAEAMRMPFRTYQAVEDGTNPYKEVYGLAARWVVTEYISQNVGEAARAHLLPRDVREVVSGVALKLSQEKAAAG